MESTLLRHIHLYTKEQVLLLQKLCDALSAEKAFFILRGNEDEWAVDRKRSSYGEGGDDHFFIATKIPKKFLYCLPYEDTEQVGHVTWAFSEEGNGFKFLNLITGDMSLSAEKSSQLLAIRSSLGREFKCPVNNFPGHFVNTAKESVAISQ